MKSRHLPTLMIDTNDPSPMVDKLANALDQHGRKSALKSVILITPKLQKRRRDGTMHVEHGRKSRLYTSESGHFHGTHHHLGNQLTRSEFVGTIVMLTHDKNDNFVMMLRPSVKRDGTADPVYPQHAYDPQTAMHTIEEFLAALDSVSKPTMIPDQVMTATTKFKTDPDHYDFSPFGDILGALDIIPLLPSPAACKNSGCAPA